MSKFTILSEVNGHDHLVYLNEGGQFGETSEDEGHKHKVLWMQPPLDPMTGQPAGPGFWYVMPFGEDGHTHEIMPEYPKKFEKQEGLEEAQEEDEIVAEVIRLYRDADGLTAESYDEFETCEKFYGGEQWDESLKTALNETNRAALTINKIETGVDDLCGFQRQNRSDTRYVPLEDGDQRKADMLNVLKKEIDSFNNWQMKESEVFLDICIGGLGFFDVGVDFKDNIEGDIKVRRMPYERVRLGPHEELDASDREVEFKYEWISIRSARARFPNKADELFTYWDFIEKGPKGRAILADERDPYLHGDKSPVDVGHSDLADITKREIKLLECQRLEYFYAPAIAHEPSGFVIDGEGWTKADVGRVKTISGVVTADRYTPKIRKTVICGGVLVYDKSPADVPGDTFSLVPVYGKRRRGKFWGKVRGALDPQRELNKRTSQTIDIVNRMIADITYYDPATFIDEADRHSFLRNSSKPGHTQRVADLGRTPKRESGISFPSEVANLIQLADSQLAAIMNIKAVPTNTSIEGALLMQQMRMALAGNEFLFDNLLKAKKQVAKLLIHYIQKYYTPARVVRLLRKAESKPGGDAMIGGAPISSYSDEEIQSLFESTDLSRYDVEVAEHAFSPTMRVATLLVLMQLAQQGVQIPLPVLVEYMELTQEAKDKIIMAYQEQQQAAAQAQDATAEMETTKTALAQGIMPPKFQYEMEQQQKQVDQMKAQEGMAQQQEGNPTLPGVLRQ
jgi:hypothetical protein